MYHLIRELSLLKDLSATLAQTQLTPDLKFKFLLFAEDSHEPSLPEIEILRPKRQPLRRLEPLNEHLSLQRSNHKRRQKEQM